MPLSRKFRLFSTIWIATALALSAAGCSAPAERSNEADSSPDQASESVLGDAPVVQVVFGFGDEKYQVDGIPDRSFCGPGGHFQFSATDSSKDSGASFAFERDGVQSVAVWATGDLAVQFAGSGDVTMTVESDGSRIFAVTDASGRAQVAPRPAGSVKRLAETDFSGGETVDATASFALRCPAS